MTNADPEYVIEVPVEGQPQDSIGDGDAFPRPPFLFTTQPAADPITVGVVDGKIWPHPLLGSSYRADADDVYAPSEDLDIDDDGRLDRQAGHATFVAGLVLQQAPAATVLVDHALNTFGTGTFKEVADAARKLVEAGVQLLNLSLGSRNRRDEWTELVDELVRRNPLLVVVAAAGNLKRDRSGYREQPFPFYPADLAHPNVVTVAGARRVDVDGERYWQPAEFTNISSTVDFAAPAVDVRSTFVRFDHASNPDWSFDEYASWSGTSQAAAIASGVIARTAAEYTGRDVLRAVQLLRQDHDLPTVRLGDRDVPLLGADANIWRPR